MKRFAILLFLLMTSAIFAQTYVSGAVSGVWDSTGSPYYVTDSVCVPSGDSLRIGPGVEVIFQGHYKFCVDENAVMKAIGTEEDSIVFTAIDTVLTDTSGGHFGIRFYYASTSCSLSYCIIEYGYAWHEPWGMYGGGINLWYTDATISHCRISRCRADWGGGICCYFSSSIISNCIFIADSARCGGAIDCSYGEPKIIGNRIIGNQAILGGGINTLRSNALIAKNIIINNYASSSGGGVQSIYNTLVLENNLIAFNESGNDGGGLHLLSSAFLVNNTICNNFAENIGGALILNSGSLVSINNIYHENIAGSDVGDEIYSNGGNLVLAYSLLPLSACFFQTGTNVRLGCGIINGETGFDSDSTFYLDPSSPCVDAGSDSVYVAFLDTSFLAPAFDLGGNLKPQGYRSDIGAYESPYFGLSNRPPRFIICPSDTSFLSGRILEQNILVNDPDEDSLEIVIHGATSAAYLVGDSVFRWDTEISDVGMYNVMITAFDGELTDTCEFTVSIYSDSGTITCGEISGVWDSTGSPYIVVCDVTVPEGDTLIIEPGVEVLFEGEFSFVVDSGAVLKAMGTSTDSIVITSIDTTVWFKGLKFYSASPECELNYCRISRSNNIGIELHTTNLDIISSCISNNYDIYNKGRFGFGIYCNNSNLRVINTSIKNNREFQRMDIHSSVCGGGLCIVYSTLNMENCIVDSNKAGLTWFTPAYGGGMYLSETQALITNSRISRNTAEGGSISYGENGGHGYGGGLYAKRSNVTIRDCILDSNVADGGNGGDGGYHEDGYAGGSGYGGAMATDSSSLIIENSLIVNNACYFGNGGSGMAGNGSPGRDIGSVLFSQSSKIFFINSTLWGNKAIKTYELIKTQNSQQTFYNTSIWESDSGTYHIMTYGGIVSVHKSNCRLDQFSNYSSIDFGTDNIETPPVFADPSSGDFHLHSASPLIDAGAESVYVAFLDTTLYAPLFDIEGNPRPRGEAWDIGAYESPYSSGSRPPYFIFCPEDTIVPAYSTVCMYFSIDDPDGDYISTSAIGADGSFLEDDTVFKWTPSIEDIGLNEISIIITDSMFYDTCTFVIDVRACGFPLAGAISGTLHVDDSPYCIFDDVYVPSGETLRIDPGVRFNFWGNYEFRIDSAAVLKAIGTASDSIVFTACDTTIGYHGGLFFFKANPCSLEYCSITEAGGNEYGGAIHVEESELVLRHSSINNNRTMRCGGGVYSFKSNLILEYNEFKSNVVDSLHGAGLAIFEGSIDFNYNLVEDNHAAYMGGGLYLDSCEARLYSNVYQGNIADILGGGLVIRRAKNVFAFGERVFNNTAQRGGGTGIISKSTVTFQNSIVDENQANEYAGGIYIASSKDIEFKNCIFKSNISGLVENGRGGAIYISAGQPKINNCLILNNFSVNNGYGGSIYSLWDSYPIIINCILSGNTATTSADELFLGYDVWDEIPHPCSLSIFNTLIDTSKCEYAEGSYIHFGDGVFYDNPMFVDTLAENFRLMRSSPCISAGAESVYVGIYHDSVFYAPEYDLLMNPRPNGIAPDIGPYEFFGPNSAPLFDNCPFDTALTSWLDTLRYSLSISDLDGDHISLFLADTAPGTHLFDTTLYIALPEIADTGEFEIKIVACDPWACDTCAFLIYIPEAIEEYYAVPRGFELFVLPNPFNSSVTILTPAYAEIEIYDVMGRRVLTDRTHPAGKQGNSIINSDSEPGVFVWRPDDKTRSGVYFVRAKSGNAEIVRRVVYLK